MKMQELRGMMLASAAKTIEFSVITGHIGTSARTLHKGTITADQGRVVATVPDLAFKASGYWQQITPVLRALKAERFEALP